MSRQLAFVQFPHPGGEHRPTSDVMPWNNGEHARKFLKGSGTYLRDGYPFRGSYVLWGEWEPPSLVSEYPRSADALPRWVHEPVWKEPERRRLLQNTDPLVFGDRFLYSNCRQTHVASLRELAPGSIIVFGSKVARAWVVDTVFVVADDPLPYLGGEAGSIEADPMTRAVLLDRIAANPKHRRSPLTLYRGRSYFDGQAAPFSFVPCRPYAGDLVPRFSRPSLTLADDRWTTDLTQAPKVTDVSEAELAALWNEIVQQTVVSPGLAMGVKIDHPRLVNDGVEDVEADLLNC